MDEIKLQKVLMCLSENKECSQAHLKKLGLSESEIFDAVQNAYLQKIDKKSDGIFQEEKYYRITRKGRDFAWKRVE